MSEENQSDKSVCVGLMGLRGCGKSAVGRLLASARQCAYVDTDELIVERAGLTISAIFSQHGEAAFRQIEHEVITSISGAAPIVISLGGGAVLDHRNLKHLQPFSTIVWLKAPAEVLAERIDGDQRSAAMRPPLTGKSTLEEIRQLAQERDHIYEQAAAWSVDTADRSLQQVADDIHSRLS